MEINKKKTFEEQTEETRNAIIADYYAMALFIPTTEIRQGVAARGRLEEEVTLTDRGRKTTFDVFARPRVLEVSQEGYTITAEREYIEQATSWRLHSETFTLTINT